MKNRAPLFAVLAAVVLTAGWWFLLYAPAADEQTALELETAELVAQTQALEDEVAELRAVQADEAGYTARLARLDRYLPLEAQQAALLDGIQAIADASGVEITNLTHGEPTPVVGAPAPLAADRVLVEIPVSMTLDGGYFQLVDLLRRLEVDSDRAVMVDTVAFTEAEAGFPELSGAWSGRIFAVMPVVAAPPATDPAATEGAADGTTPEATASEAPGTAPGATGPSESADPAGDEAVQADGAGDVTS